MRLMEAGTPPHALTALFLTHIHSDHVVGLPDVAMTGGSSSSSHPSGPLVVVAARGVAARFVSRMLEPYDDDLSIRTEHTGATPIEVVLQPFDVPTTPDVVWTSDDGQIRVLAVAVHHEPVPDAVAYRIETPDATVVVSGDTRVCSEVEHLSIDADLLVHEACRTSAMQPLISGTVFETIFSYHADTVELGEMATRAGVPHVVLTHLIPPPEVTGDAEAFRARSPQWWLPGPDHGRRGFDGDQPLTGPSAPHRIAGRMRSKGSAEQRVAQPGSPPC